jgi:hypothetical protein
MNYLNGKMVYLCGAMFGYDDSGIGWRDMLTPNLREMGIEVVDPTKTTANGVGEVEDDKKKFRDLREQLISITKSVEGYSANTQASDVFKRQIVAKGSERILEAGLASSFEEADKLVYQFLKLYVHRQA